METLLIFTGGDTPPADLLDDLPQPDLTIAADSGYDAAVKVQHPVDVLVGDMDSISVSEVPEHVIVERHPEDKDASDLELALELAVRENPARIVIVGGSGGRVDHELSATLTICSDRWAGVDEIDWITPRGRAHVIRRRRILHGDVGALLSLIAVGGDATEVNTTGLRWNLDAETIFAGSSRGLSNIMEAPVTDIRVGGGCLLAVFPTS